MESCPTNVSSEVASPKRISTAPDPGWYSSSPQRRFFGCYAERCSHSFSQRRPPAGVPRRRYAPAPSREGPFGPRVQQPITDARTAGFNKVDSCLSNLTRQRPSWSARRAKRHRCRQHPGLSSFPADPGDCPPLQRTETHLTWDVLAPFRSARSWFVG
jgi:hypothetical protein